MLFAYTLFVIVIMLVLNGLLAAYEMALASVSRARLSVLLGQNKKGAHDAIFMKDRIEASLTVVQLGITFVGAFAAAVGGAGVEKLLTPYFIELGFSAFLAQVVSIVFLIVPLSCVTIIFAELIPKTLALNNKEWVCLKFSPNMRLLWRMTHPVVSLFEWVVKKIIVLLYRNRKITLSSDAQQSLYELKAAAALARTARLMGAREEKIILAAAHLSIRKVRDIIIPVSDISLVFSGNTLTEAFLKAHMDMHTRFPVAGKENDPQTIEGYINFKDIVVALKLNPANPTIKGITRPLKSFADSMPISQVLEQMIQEKIHIGLVRGQDTQILGLVTLEDIIEELVGEIEDEFDRLPAYVHPYGPSWLMGGGVRMDTLAATAGIPLPPEAVSLTLAEWCVKKLGRSLEGGEIIETEGLVVTVRKLRRKKLSEALVSLTTSS